MTKKIAQKKAKKESLELNVPEDFVGEVIGTVSKGSEEIVVSPLLADFHNEELNLIRDKINEIITKIA